MQQTVERVPTLGSEEVIPGAQVMGFIIGGGFLQNTRDTQGDKAQQQGENRQAKPLFPCGNCGWRLRQ